MKNLKMSSLMLAVVLVSSVKVSAAVRVSGYLKSNGTYVSPHYRTVPDRYSYNNYSYKGQRSSYWSIGD